MAEPGTLPVHQRDDEPTPDVSCCLFCIVRADRPLASSSRHCLDALDEVDIGRGDEMSAERIQTTDRKRLVLRVPDARISSRHAFLRRDGARWIVEDQGSTNGVWINGARRRSAKLADGDVVELGHTFFLFREVGPLAPKTPHDLIATELVATAGALRTWVPSLATELQRLAAAARSTIPILVQGPTGSGKEVVARAIHELSGRAGAFVPLNAGAVPPQLVASVLFGHTKGAFSGAHTDRLGLVTAADGGTLFLDEIGDLALDLQPSLLRTLQEGEVLPVGSSQPRRVDLRVVAATHRDLEHMVEVGAFREDLLARLAGFQLTLPPLVERREDLGLLIPALLERLAPDRAGTIRFEPEAARALLLYDWPRNVRELERALATALAVASDSTIALEHLPPGPRPGPEPPALRRDLTDEEQQRRRQIVAALAETAGNISAAARVLGKPRSQIQRWIKRYQIDVPGRGST